MSLDNYGGFSPALEFPHYVIVFLYFIFLMLVFFQQRLLELLVWSKDNSSWYSLWLQHYCLIFYIKKEWWYCKSVEITSTVVKFG